MPTQTIMLILLTGGMLLLIAVVTHFSGQGSLDNIKSKTVGDGQHGTARWADNKEIAQTYKHVPFRVGEWRSGKNLPKQQGNDELSEPPTADKRLNSKGAASYAQSRRMSQDALTSAALRTPMTDMERSDDGLL